MNLFLKSATLFMVTFSFGLAGSGLAALQNNGTEKVPESKTKIISEVLAKKVNQEVQSLFKTWSQESGTKEGNNAFKAHSIPELLEKIKKNYGDDGIDALVESLIVLGNSAEPEQREFNALFEPHLEFIFESQKSANTAVNAIRKIWNDYFEKKNQEYEKAPKEEVKVIELEEGKIKNEPANSEHFGVPGLFKTPKEDNSFALTYDDGPHPTRTPKLLELLDKYSRKATFFMIGSRIKIYQKSDIPLLVQQKGHSLASHTMNHPNLRSAALSLSKKQKEIMNGAISLQNALGLADLPKLFRYPYGNTTKLLDDYILKNEMVSVLWDLDSEDWKISDPIKLLNRFKNLMKVHNYGVILFHDIHRQTEIIMPEVMQILKKRAAQTYTLAAAEAVK